MAYCCVGRHENKPGALWCRECGSLVEGAMVGDYRVLSFVGKGSTAEVYLAEQPVLMQRKVVIKILPYSLSGSRVETFRREAAVLASLSHPYILPIFSYGLLYREMEPGEAGDVEQEQAGQASEEVRCFPYLVLSYARRGSLADMFVREGRRPWSLHRVVTIAREIADALDYAHSQGVLHRDVKPANILYMGTHALLSDFSVATLIEADVSHLDAPWAGSPAYMAPEVWQLRPGRYSDQYSLAVTCFYLLSSDLPWRRKEGTQSRSWVHLHSFVPPRPILELRPDLPIAVDLVLQRALAKNPHDRYATVSAFAADLAIAAQDNTQNLVALIDTREIGTKGEVGADLSRPSPINRPAGATSHTPDGQRVEAPALAQQAPDTAPVDPSQGQQLQAKVPGEVATEALSPTEENSRWILHAILLNLIICLALAGESWLQNGLPSAGTFLLAVWPAILIGPLVAVIFRRVRFASLSWGLFWGTFFGLTNGLLSALACLVWVVLVRLVADFRCPPWCGSGDGLTLALNELTRIAPYALLPFVAGLWMSVIGGALIGIFNLPSYSSPERI